MLSYEQLKNLIKGKENIFNELLSNVPIKSSYAMSWDANVDDIKKLVEEEFPSLNKEEKIKALVTLLTTIPCAYPIIKNMLGDVMKDINILSMFLDLEDNPSIIEDYRDYIDYESLCSNQSYIDAKDGSELGKLKAYYSLLADSKKEEMSQEDIMKLTIAQLEGIA